MIMHKTKQGTKKTKPGQSLLDDIQCLMAMWSSQFDDVQQLTIWQCVSMNYQFSELKQSGKVDVDH